MKQNVLVKRSVMPQRVCLLNDTSFIVKYERVSRKNLPSNMTIRQTKTTGPRNRRTRKKKVRFPYTATQKSARRIIKKYSNKRKKKAQQGGSLIGNLAEWGISMGSKAINSGLGKKLIDEGIKYAPELYKLGTSKIKNKNVKRALNSDVANYIVTETKKKQNTI